MYLTGSIKDLKNILILAEDLRATAIHFIAPNTVFILAKNKQDYIFAKTGLVIGYSMMLPESSYSNLLMYLKTLKRGFGNKESIFYQKYLTSFAMTTGKLLLDGSSQVLMEIEIPSYPLKKEVEFKMDDAIASTYDRNAPYLRFTSQHLKELQKQKAKFKKKYGSASTRSADNSIRIEDDQLVLYFFVNNQFARVETNIRNFSTNMKEAFSFSDKALYLMCWLNNISYSEDVILLPRQEYCVMEGYHDEMTVKVRTSIKNDLILDEKRL
jgi:hypothetical protein